MAHHTLYQNKQSVRDVTYQLLRDLGLTTIFGNLGSTEEIFLKNSPKDSGGLPLAIRPLIKKPERWTASRSSTGVSEAPPPDLVCCSGEVA